jgi:hypothetical protein
VPTCIQVPGGALSHPNSEDPRPTRNEFAVARKNPSGRSKDEGPGGHSDSKAVNAVGHCSAGSLGRISSKCAATSPAVAALSALMVYGAPVMAQEQARTQSVEIYGGELFGDDLTNTPVSGRTPRLNDDATFGARYNYNFTDMWGVQLSGGSPKSGARTRSETRSCSFARNASGRSGSRPGLYRSRKR